MIKKIRGVRAVSLLLFYVAFIYALTWMSSGGSSILFSLHL
jgi:hypothetical protein